VAPVPSGAGGCDAWHAARAYLVEVAAGLGDRAELRIDESTSDEESIALLPREPGALAVEIEHNHEDDDDLWCTVAGFGEEIDLENLRHVVESVVAGRVTIWEGTRARQVSITYAEDDVRSSTEWRSCLWVPGWRRRAQVVRATPYT